MSLQQQQQQPTWQDYLPSPNRRRIKELIARRRHQIKDHLSLDDDDLDNDPDPKIAAAAGIAAYVLTGLQVFILLPWYMTDWTDKKAVAVYKSEYLLPAALLLGFIGVPGSGLLGFWIGVTLVFVRFLPWLVATQFGIMQGSYAEMIGSIDPYGSTDSTEISDDKYLIPSESVGKTGGDTDPLPTLRKDRSILALGESGSGKTSAIKTLAAQFHYSDSTAVVAHGSPPKGRGESDYAEFFKRIGVPYETISIDSDKNWNLFREIDPNDSKNPVKKQFKDLSKIIIPTEDYNNMYFPEGAQIIFSRICQIVYEDYDDPGHDDLLNAFNKDAESTIDLLENRGYHRAANQMKGKDGGPSETWKTMSTKIDDLFFGGFGEHGTFSFREYFENPRGRAIVVETPDTAGAMASTYAAMVDQACRYANSTTIDTYLLLDEADTIGRMQNIKDVAARGRSWNTRTIVGIQSKSQLEVIYGKKTDGLLGNLQQTVGMSTGDKDSTKELQETVGERKEASRSVTQGQDPSSLASAIVGSQSETVSEEIRYPIQSGEIQNWKPGTGLVSTDDSWYVVNWIHPDEAIPMAAERGSVSVSDPDDPADPESADANWSESSRSSEGQTEWVEVSNTDDGGRSR